MHDCVSFIFSTCLIHVQRPDENAIVVVALELAHNFSIFSIAKK